jgi:serine/threonine protein phosphatase PrpC
MVKIDGLEEVGLLYDGQQKQITGSPVKSGDFSIKLKFKLEGQAEDEPFIEKLIPLIINPDPKSLWKNIESDKNDPYWKENDITVFQPISERDLLASSKRGRAHANVGSFREDDFASAELENGWSIIVVSDGAGSAKLSRHGSHLACQEVISFFSSKESVESMKEFDSLIEDQDSESTADKQNKIKLLVYNNLGKAAFSVHKKLEEFAAEKAIPIKDLSCTLIFTLFKKYSSGYALLSFGVGDCPIAVLDKDVTEVTLLNWIDVGEFGGGTRFITMPEVFKNENFATRFSFKQVPDFSFLILMTDGIYDPKFVVEANLGDISKWRGFLEDLGGKNDEGVKVELMPDNDQIAEQLSKWMDFWSVGNHDDRTLAIVF